MSRGACPPASAGPAESLFKESYYQLMKTALKEDGILCCQGEGARVDWVLLCEPGGIRLELDQALPLAGADII